MTSGGFTFASGNLAKLLALPKYLLSAILAWFVPRIATEWVFGSGIGVGEGALTLARQLRAEGSYTRISWLVADDDEARAAEAEGFEAVHRASRHGYWRTLRAGRIVVTHGLGDVNRFGVFGGFVVQLWHGAPLKRLHLDSPVTTEVGGPAIVRGLLRRMYLQGSKQVDLFVAGSVLSAERLRSAFRLLPGKVRVLGDPRDDQLADQARNPQAARAARVQLIEAIGAPGIGDAEQILLYAPTWRDGAPDPGIPNEAEARDLEEMLARTGSYLVVRSHPLGSGSYEHLGGGRIRMLDAATVRDVTPLLGGFDAVITDYSSLAIDFSLLGRPIVWFAPDLERYEQTRGLYEPLLVTSGGRVERDWGEVTERIEQLIADPAKHLVACAHTREIASRYHDWSEGGAAARVLTEIERLQLPARNLVTPDALFFESYYGRQVSCNPLALDREIASRHPELTRYWSITSERQQVPEGAIPLLVGGREWFAARRLARTVIVNDWLRLGFTRRRGQLVVQTWHGTMLKRLALGRPDVRLRTRLAIRRESRRWDLMLSQNPHSTEQFRSSYAFSGEIVEAGYPRDDRLARARLATGPNPIDAAAARAALGIPPGVSVISYVPTWRDAGTGVVDELNVAALAAELGEDWVVVVRGHTRTHEFGSYLLGDSGVVIDASQHPDIADVCLASDVLVTDYSSVMFDASVARVPMLFFVPDIASYRDRERGFTFDFEGEAPGPLLTTRSQVVDLARQVRDQGESAPWIEEHRGAFDAWIARFNPHDDGHAASRVVDLLEARGALG